MNGFTCSDAAIERIMDAGESARCGDDNQTMMVTRDLTMHFQGPHGVVRALDGVSLTVQAGEFVAVMGPSGSGKTTLLQTIGGLLAPDRGTVLFGETDLFALSSEQRAAFRAREIGFVFQQFHLIPYLTVIENILAPSMACPCAEAVQRAEDLTERFQLRERRDHIAAALSSGERQRTALARALLNGPRLLLADEPTGNLDWENARVVLGHLTAFTLSGGAVLLVTHDPQVSAVAGRIVQVTAGRIDSEGTSARVSL